MEGNSEEFPSISLLNEKIAAYFAPGAKYPEQIAHLKESNGFSQTHANALVVYSRGSTSLSKAQILFTLSRFAQFQINWNFSP